MKKKFTLAEVKELLYRQRIICARVYYDLHGCTDDMYEVIKIETAPEPDIIRESAKQVN